MSEVKCWLCDSDDIVYKDSVELFWCGTCYQDIYLDSEDDLL